MGVSKLHTSKSNQKHFFILHKSGVFGYESEPFSQTAILDHFVPVKGTLNVAL